MKTSVLAVVGIILFSMHSYADVKGTARIVDGDTIHFLNAKVRLDGIDAPERKQTCVGGSHVWECGKRSTRALERLINGNQVSCTELGKDRYKRIIGVCYSNGLNLNAEMVNLGMAVAYRRYSKDYVENEEQAKLNKVGMWRGKFVMPWDYRRGKRLREQD